MLAAKYETNKSHHVSCRRIGVIRLFSLLFCFFSFSYTFGQISELSQFRSWLCETMTDEDVSNLFYQIQKGQEHNAKVQKEKEAIEQKNSEDKKAIQNNIDEIEIKIRNLGLMERDEFETKQQFQERKKQHDSYQETIKILENKMKAIDNASKNLLLKDEKQKPYPIAKGNIKLSHEHLTLERFDIDSFCFPCFMFCSFNKKISYFYKKTDDEIWDGSIYFSPNKEGSRIKVFDLYFSTPEEARNFKQGFESGAICLTVPVDISFSFDREQDRILVSPEETEVDVSAIAKNVGEAALQIGLAFIAESLSPGSSSYMTPSGADRKTKRVTKEAEYRFIPHNVLSGSIRHFPESVFYSSQVQGEESAHGFSPKRLLEK